MMRLQRRLGFHSIDFLFPSVSGRNKKKDKYPTELALVAREEGGRERREEEGMTIMKVRESGRWWSKKEG